MPKRLQLRRTKGYRKPPDAVTVRRPTRWGNAYPVKTYGREEALRLFEAWLIALPADERETYLAPLRGKDLACVCALDQPCHADIWLRWANETTPRQPSPRAPSRPGSRQRAAPLRFMGRFPPASE